MARDLYQATRQVTAALETAAQISRAEHLRAAIDDGYTSTEIDMAIRASLDKLMAAGTLDEDTYAIALE